VRALKPGLDLLHARVLPLILRSFAGWGRILPCCTRVGVCWSRGAVCSARLLPADLSAAARRKYRVRFILLLSSASCYPASLPFASWAEQTERCTTWLGDPPSSRGEWSCPEVSFGNIFGDDNGHADGGAPTARNSAPLTGMQPLRDCCKPSARHVLCHSPELPAVSQLSCAN